MKKRFLALFLFFLPFIVVFCILFFRYISPFFSRRSIPDLHSHDKNYHILITGQAENSTFLKQVYEGAKKSAEYYNAVVELYVPKSQAEDISLARLMDYASYVSADGLIVFLNKDSRICEQPYRLDGEEIPVITLGNYIPEFPQVSFIGSNYSELGRRIAFEVRQLVEEGSGLFIISSAPIANLNFSTMMNSMQIYFKNTGINSYYIFDKTTIENQKLLMNAIHSGNFRNLIFVCLSEEDTISTAQLFARTPENSTVKIIGFGETETAEMYLEKGTVTKLISLDRKKIGESAMNELFEYRNKGYANSYVPAEIKIRTARR